MSYTSINISNSDYKFKYVIEYMDNEEYIDNSCFYTINDNVISFYEDEDPCWVKNNSILTNLDKKS